MNVGSLFSGIGGLDLGLERAGMTVVWQSEIDPYACRVLAKHWPNVPNLGDITAIDWSTVEPVDVICGGYPCQPFSLAGVRRGEADPRHLWPHFHRAIRYLRPRYALLENVPGHLSLGFDRVLGDLAEIGYDVEWCSIPAAAVGAPHLRWRLFAVAHPRSVEHQGGGPPVGWAAPTVLRADTASGGATADEQPRRVRGVEQVRDAVPDTDRFGCDGDDRVPSANEGEVRDASRRNHRSVRAVVRGRQRVTRRASPADVADTAGERRPRRIVPRTNMVNDGPQPTHGHARAGRDASWWAIEPDVGRVAHGVPSRVDRLRCLGNAVVPQVAEWIGRRIVEAAA